MFDKQCILMEHDVPRFARRLIRDFVVCGSASDMTAGEVKHQRPTGLEQFLHILEMFYLFIFGGRGLVYQEMRRVQVSYVSVRDLLLMLLSLLISILRISHMSIH